MESIFVSAATADDDAIPLIPVTRDALPDLLARNPERWRNWVEQSDFKAESGSLLHVPADDGRTAAVLLGHEPERSHWMLAQALKRLWPGLYRLESAGIKADVLITLLVGWGLAGYRFERYRKAEKPLPRLVWPEGVDRARVEALVAAHRLARDLINTPPADMMPVHLALAARELAEEFGAGLRVISDDEALEEGFPCIHTVGAASAFSPRVIELTWGRPDMPHVVLVGKGVCFDSGGLNLKPGNSMRLMKKDMGGAAIVLGLARAIMALGLPVRITALVGAVENAVGSRSFRPGDVLKARNGKTIEIDNTDAEGRLVLADLLVRAGECHPDLVIDFATLTGAARVAVGTEIAAFFSDDEVLAADLQAPAGYWDDPVWRLPLHEPYRHLLDSRVADLVNSSSGGYAGAITAALFLKEFAPEGVPWLHFDVMAWNTRARPGRPKGGEAMGLRAVLGLLEARHGQGSSGPA
ncbi:peptidase M17 leucyl aminopeptidase domain protein [Thioalkalivibrio nitratireducens DSM 14787]|uniref:Peptidase M17 leucyl aminopeptidase domain protein n=1 Tax=Thioalkalivibrio nitratireducens (strain DSM 14787 / UNIQEM 213 / ALEN2) TaxID=1255043 RepID=L0DW10_THIND|nr:leucyl aminopeptidase family protein [Thioalkalivibrio nitratireducens]AGA33202.1 peptidase M17 leucyl aminopeptidase domain protein [Thioalkalivibrio nitratireducens DSM 14787]